MNKPNKFVFQVLFLVMESPARYFITLRVILSSLEIREYKGTNAEDTHQGL